MEVWVRQFRIGGGNKAKRSFHNPFFHSALWKLFCNKKPEHWFETDGTGLQMEYGQILRTRSTGTFWGEELARLRCICWKEKEHFHFWQSSWDIPSQGLRTHSFSGTQNSFPDRTAPSFKKHIAAIHQCNLMKKHYRRCHRENPNIRSRSKQSQELELMLQVLQNLWKAIKVYSYNGKDFRSRLAAFNLF